MGVSIIPLMGFFIYWGLYGGNATWEERKEVFIDLYSKDKLFNSYVVDISLFYIWQFILIRAPLIYKAIPFFGPALWLIIHPDETSKNVTWDKKSE